MFFLKRIVSRFFRKSGIFFMRMESLLGFSPSNIRYYEEAFTYPSAKKEQANYQRLEFLGDAVLSVVISHYLFVEFRGFNEGKLTHLRSKIVRREALNRIGEEMKLASFLTASQQQLNKHINGNLLEALVGAIYLDKGYDASKAFIHQKVLCKSNLERIEREVISYKSILLEWAQRQRHTVSFQFEEVSFDDSPQPLFLCKTILSNGYEAQAKEFSKRKAEEIASKHIVETYNLAHTSF